MVGLHRAVLGGDRGALDQGQQVALHAFAGDVGAGAVGAAGDLVDLVDEDDAGVLGQVDGLGGQGVLIDQLVALLGNQRDPGAGDGGLLRLGAAAEGLAHDVAKVEHADRGARLAGDVHALQRAGGVGEIEFDLLVVKLAGAKLLAE